MHEQAFGIIISFGSKQFLHIYAILCIDASLHSLTTLHVSASPNAFLISLCSLRLAGVSTFESFLPLLVSLAVSHAASPSPGAGIVPLVADYLTQLSGGLIVTPATISSPAAVPALQSLVSTPNAQLPVATRLPNVPVTLFDSLRLFATISLESGLDMIALRSPPSSTPTVAAPVSAGPQGGERSPSSPIPGPSQAPRPRLSRRVVRAHRYRALPSQPPRPP